MFKRHALGLIWVSLLTFWFGVVAFIVLLALPHNPLSLEVDGKALFNTRSVLPEGFGFFTRDPREPKYTPYHKIEEQWKTDRRFRPVASPNNLFGIKRATRAQTTEYAFLLKHIEVPQWVSCGETTPEACFEKQDTVLTVVENPIPAPTICGPYGLAVQETVPWAWSKSRAEINMPAQIIMFYASCP